YIIIHYISLLIFYFTAASPTDVYTLSLHDALPIFTNTSAAPSGRPAWRERTATIIARRFGSTPVPTLLGIARSVGATSAWISSRDRKSTRLNSSHVSISYAVFCLKKKK